MFSWIMEKKERTHTQPHTDDTKNQAENSSWKQALVAIISDLSHSKGNANTNFAITPRI